MNIRKHSFSHRVIGEGNALYVDYINATTIQNTDNYLTARNIQRLGMEYTGSSLMLPWTPIQHSVALPWPNAALLGGTARALSYLH